MLLESSGSSPNERRAILQSYIEPTEEELEHGRKAPNAGHRAIVQMVRHGSAWIIVTTNCHRLIENAPSANKASEPTIVAVRQRTRLAPPAGS